MLLINSQQNRRSEIIRPAVGLIKLAVLLPVFSCPLGGGGGYSDGKGVQFVAGQPIGEAVFDQAVAGEAGLAFKIGGNDGGKKVMASPIMAWTCSGVSMWDSF